MGLPYPGVWSPAGGLALALVAWFGPRAALIPLAAGAVALLPPSTGPKGWTAFATCVESSANVLEALVGCWLFLRLAGGARRLADPRSAVAFVLLLPGLAAAVGAVTRAAAGSAAGTVPVAREIVALWLSHALGLLVVTPPLLAGLTPWMIRRGLTPEDPPDAQPALPGPVGADELSRGDYIEIAGLAIGAGGMGLLLALAPGARVMAGWQVWGAPLLLIVWASLRQGLIGGTVVSCAAVAVPLTVLSLAPAPADTLLLQGNLLAQAGTGLLVAASASWLRSSERRYRQLVAHVPVVVYSVRLEGDPPAARVSLVSAASVALLGCPPDQFLGDHELWLEHVHPDDREVYRAALSQLRRQDEPVACEYRFAPQIPADWGTAVEVWAPTRRASGVVARARTSGLRWVRDTLAAHRDGAGQLTGWEGVVTDITEQRMLADDLRRTSNMLSAIISDLPLGVFFVQGSQGRPTLVNARARALLGQREDVTLDRLATVYRLHRPDGSRYPPEELPVARALRGDRAAMCDDIVVHRPDGRRVPLVTWAAPVRLVGDGPDAAVWMLEDLTALQQVEAVRRDNNGRLRVVVETMGDALLVTDRKGIVSEANAAAADLFGGEPGALCGRQFFDFAWAWLDRKGNLVAPDEHPARTALRTGRPVRGVLLGYSRDGGSTAAKWVVVNASPLGSPATGVVLTFTDVSGTRNVENVWDGEELVRRDAEPPVSPTQASAERGDAPRAAAAPTV